jgi:hypothetical protein
VPLVECEWAGPAASDSEPDSARVLAMPLVADLPNDSGGAGEIVVMSYNGLDGSKDEPGKYGVIRILNGRTCALLETVGGASDPLRAAAAPALADLDNDGKIDIVARRNDNGLVAFRWDDGQHKFVKWWSADGDNILGVQAWDGPSIHDLDDDGFAEVLLRTAVYDGRTGTVKWKGGVFNAGFVNSPMYPFNGLIPVVADLNGDQKPDLVADLFAAGVTSLPWDQSHWVMQGLPLQHAGHFAVADFGTPGATEADFRWGALDGIAEIVAVDDAYGTVYLMTPDGQIVVQAPTVDPTLDRGGIPTVADFDGDGQPEIAVAGATKVRVFDPDCRPGGPKRDSCAADWILWAQPIQDATSAQTASSAFDFDGDGKMELVFADECFLRIYDGSTGRVSYSMHRASGTWYEGPPVADVNHDGSADIVLNSNGVVTCPSTGMAGVKYVDPTHPGVPCHDDSGCVSGTGCVSGYCRCANDGDCGAPDTGLTCAPPIFGGSNVCRATHPNSGGLGGVRVLGEKSGRWAGARAIWNQHAYAITNVLDDGKVPKTSAWQRNWTHKGFNNFRANASCMAAP